MVKVTQSGCSLTSFALSRVPFLYIGQRGAGVSAEQLGRVFHAQVDRTLGCLRYQPHVRVLEVGYNLLLREPDAQAQAQQIGLFLGRQDRRRLPWLRWSIQGRTGSVSRASSSAPRSGLPMTDFLFAQLAGAVAASLVAGWLFARRPQRFVAATIAIR